MRSPIFALVAAVCALASSARAQSVNAPAAPASAPPPPAALIQSSDPQAPAPPPMIHVDAPAPQAEPGSALVVIGDDGGLNYQAVRALRGLAVGQLRKRGVAVFDDVRAEGTLQLEAAQRLMRETHAARGFSVQVQGRLGNKVPLAFEEISADGKVPLFSAQLTASSLDECDVIIPRLVNAVLDRKAAEDNAEMASVTAKESQPFRKKPGEMHLAAGLVIPTFSGPDSSGSPFGLSAQLFYEVEHFNIGVEGLFGTYRGLTAGGLFFQGNWLPIDGEVSPYIGAGIGYMGADSNGGLGFKAQIGVEALRLHQIRVLAGFEALIPLFSTSDSLIGGSSSGNGDRHILPMLFLQFSL